MEFLDRVEERTRLDRVLDGREGAFACLYGRRRCGKSRLLRECVKGRPNCLYHVADRSERAAQLARFVAEAGVLFPGMRAASTDDWGAVLDLWAAVSPTGSVLVLDEFPYLVEMCPELPSVLQRIVDALPESGRKIVVCGSSQRMMQGLVLKANEPLYGRAAEIVPVRPLPFGWMRRAFPKASAGERLRMWGAWGGVPRYWELQQGFGNLTDALQVHLAPLGVLRHEPDFLLMDDVGDVAQAATVLSFVGAGAHRVSEIAARMNRSATDLSRPLQRLTELDLIARDQPFDAGAGGKKSLYRIADPFLDFWYAFVRPRWSRDTFLRTEEDRESFERDYRVHLGGVWERLVRETLKRRPLPDSDIRWCRVSRWWGSGLDHKPMELDVIAESEDGKTLLVGEAKLSLGRAEAVRCLTTLKEKAAQLPFAQKYEKVLTRLFVAGNPPPDAVSQAWCETIERYETK